MARQVRPKEGRSACQEIPCSEADEPSHAKEIVGDDESKMGGEEEGGVRRVVSDRLLLAETGQQSQRVISVQL